MLDAQDSCYGTRPIWGWVKTWSSKHHGVNDLPGISGIGLKKSIKVSYRFGPVHLPFQNSTHMPVSDGCSRIPHAACVQKLIWCSCALA